MACVSCVVWIFLTGAVRVPLFVAMVFSRLPASDASPTRLVEAWPAALMRPPGSVGPQASLSGRRARRWVRRTARAGRQGWVAHRPQTHRATSLVGVRQSASAVVWGTMHKREAACRVCYPCSHVHTHCLRTADRNALPRVHVSRPVQHSTYGACLTDVGAA